MFSYEIAVEAWPCGKISGIDGFDQCGWYNMLDVGI